MALMPERRIPGTFVRGMYVASDERVCSACNRPKKRGLLMHGECLSCHLQRVLAPVQEVV